MAFTVAEMAGLFLVLWGLFHWLDIFAKTRVVLVLLAVTGIGGFLGHMLVRAAAWLQHATGTVTGWALGVSIPGALFVVLAALLVHDMHPRKDATRRTGYLAIGAGALLVAGVAGIPALAPVSGALHSLLGTITGFINTL